MAMGFTAVSSIPIGNHGSKVLITRPSPSIGLKPWRNLSLCRCSSTNDGKNDFRSSDWKLPTGNSSKAKEVRRNMRHEVAMQWYKKLGEQVTHKIPYPDYIDEDDPNWGSDDESGDGWGFRMDKIFKRPKIMKNDNETDSDSDIDNIDWDDEQHCEWMVREISQLEWQEVIFDDQRPVLVYVFERYGPSWSESWDTLKELEKAVKTFYDKKKIGLRVAKIDKGRNLDLVAALNLESVPALLIISNSKLLHRIYGFRTEDEILQTAAHFFHGGRKPDFLKEGLETKPEMAPEFRRKKKSVN